MEKTKTKKEKVYKTVINETIDNTNKFDKISKVLKTLVALLRISFKGSLKLSVTQSMEEDRDES